jgi:hypothetical protein
MFRTPPCPSSGALIYCCFHGVSASFVVAVYAYVDVVWFDVFFPACFVVPDGRDRLVQFLFDVSESVAISCLFGNDNLHVHGSVHHPT